MKAKKWIALIMSAAMVMGTAALFTACDPDKGENGPGTSQGGNEGGNEQGGEDNFVADDNNYYAVGSGKGTLKANGWNPKNDNIPLIKDTTVTDENVYTIRLEMYAGDAFKICMDAA